MSDSIRSAETCSTIEWIRGSSADGTAVADSDWAPAAADRQQQETAREDLHRLTNSRTH